MAKTHKSIEPVKTATELTEMYFLDIRSALLETAAFFDRLERCPDRSVAIHDNPQVKQLLEACQLLVDSPEENRTISLLKHFSVPNSQSEEA